LREPVVLDRAPDHLYDRSKLIVGEVDGRHDQRSRRGWQEREITTIFSSEMGQGPHSGLKAHRVLSRAERCKRYGATDAGVVRTVCLCQSIVAACLAIARVSKANEADQ
jgi:hypothetical protein